MIGVAQSMSVKIGLPSRLASATSGQSGVCATRPSWRGVIE
jgi:hypothetical protein